MQTSIRISLGLAFHPSETVNELKRGPRVQRWGIVAWLVMGSLYTLAVFVGYLKGFGATIEPWLRIPAEGYYLWETLFTLPVYLILYSAAAGIMEFVFREFGGKGASKRPLRSWRLAMWYQCFSLCGCLRRLLYWRRRTFEPPRPAVSRFCPCGPMQYVRWPCRSG